VSAPLARAVSGSRVADVRASDPTAGSCDGYERSVAIVDPVDEAGADEALDVRVRRSLAQPVRQRERLEADDPQALDPPEQLEAPGPRSTRSTHRSTRPATASTSTCPCSLTPRDADSRELFCISAYRLLAPLRLLALCRRSRLHPLAFFKPLLALGLHPPPSVFSPPAPDSSLTRFSALDPLDHLSGQGLPLTSIAHIRRSPCGGREVRGGTQADAAPRLGIEGGRYATS